MKNLPKYKLGDTVMVTNPTESSKKYGFYKGQIFKIKAIRSETYESIYWPESMIIKDTEGKLVSRPNIYGLYENEVSLNFKRSKRDIYNLNINSLYVVL